MIHRFLLFDKDFNCRLDRFYPLHSKLNEKSNSALLRSATTELPVTPAQGSSTKQYGNWQVLQLDDEPVSTTLSAAISALSLTKVGETEAEDKQIEHSQKLLLGATHSLRNMLLKLSPQVKNPTLAAKAFNASEQNSTLVDGYSFNYRTSAYRLHYFESFTGYRLLLLETSTSSSAATTTTVPTAYGPVSVDGCLRSLYAELIAGYCIHYPLGQVSVNENDDAFKRAGFLNRLDEYITSIEKLF